MWWEQGEGARTYGGGLSEGVEFLEQDHVPAVLFEKGLEVGGCPLRRRRLQLCHSARVLNKDSLDCLTCAEFALCSKDVPSFLLNDAGLLKTSLLFTNELGTCETVEARFWPWFSG